MRHCPVAVHEGQGDMYSTNGHDVDVERLAVTLLLLLNNQAVRMTPSFISTCQVEGRSRVEVQMRLQMYHIEAICWQGVSGISNQAPSTYPCEAVRPRLTFLYIHLCTPWRGSRSQVAGRCMRRRRPHGAIGCLESELQTTLEVPSKRPSPCCLRASRTSSLLSLFLLTLHFHPASITFETLAVVSIACLSPSQQAFSHRSCPNPAPSVSLVPLSPHPRPCRTRSRLSSTFRCLSYPPFHPPTSTSPAAFSPPPLRLPHPPQPPRVVASTIFRAPLISRLLLLACFVLLVSRLFRARNLHIVALCQSKPTPMQ